MKNATAKGSRRIRAQTQKQLANAIITGKLAGGSPILKPEPEPQEKIHLNIGDRLKDLYKRLIQAWKEKLLPLVRGDEAKATGGRYSEGLKGVEYVAKVIFGYGIIGSLLLFLFMMFLPLDFALSKILRASIELQLIVTVLGAGAFMYLFFDISEFLSKLKRQEKK